MSHVHPHLAHLYANVRLDEMRRAAGDSRRRRTCLTDRPRQRRRT